MKKEHFDHIKAIKWYFCNQIGSNILISQLKFCHNFSLNMSAKIFDIEKTTKSSKKAHKKLIHQYKDHLILIY